MDLFSTEALGPFLWRSTTVLATAFLLNATLFRRCPSRRYATLVASVLLIPLLWITAGLEWSVAEPPSTPPPAPAVEAVEFVAVPSIPLQSRLALASDRWNGPGRWLGESLHEAGPKRSESTLTLGHLLFGLWLFGGLVCVFRHYRRWRGLRMVLSRSRLVDDPALSRRFRELLQRLQVTRRIHLLQVDDLPGPCAAGIFAPVILIPDGPCAEDEIEATLAHEILHHRRHDLLFQFLGQAIRALFWFQPLVHLACRAAAIEREKAVDLTVVDALGRPDRYAELLVNSAKRIMQAGVKPALSVAPLGDGASALRRRIEMLLSHSRFSVSRRPRMFAAAIGFVFCLSTLFLLMTSEGQAQHGTQESGGGYAIETGEPGRYRMYMGLETVSRVELDGKELRAEDWTYHKDEEILEVRVPVADPMKLEGFGKRAVPWIFNLHRLYSDKVTVKVGDRELEKGKEFTVNVETRTIRFLIDVMQGPRQLFSMSFERSPEIFTSIMHNVGQRKPKPTLPPELEGLTSTRIVPTERAGHFRLSLHLREVKAVRLSRDVPIGGYPENTATLRPGIDYAFSGDTGLLELKVEVDPDRDYVAVYGERDVPWGWTFEGLDADSVRIRLGDRVAERDVDYTVDASAGTIRLMRAEDCGEDAQYRVDLMMKTKLGMSQHSFGNIPAVRGDSETGGRPKYVPLKGPQGQTLQSTGLWKTADPRIFVPTSPVLKGAHRLVWWPMESDGVVRSHGSRGEDFLFDPLAQRVVLPEGRSIDLDTHKAALWAEGIAPQTTQFPVKIDREALRVTVNGQPLAEGAEGYEILEGDTCVRVHLPPFDASNSRWKVELEMKEWKTSWEVGRFFASTSFGAGDR